MQVKSVTSMKPVTIVKRDIASDLPIASNGPRPKKRRGEYRMGKITSITQLLNNIKFESLGSLIYWRYLRLKGASNG